LKYRLIVSHSSAAIADRKSGIPRPELEEVIIISGYAAEWEDKSSDTDLIKVLKSGDFILSVFVSTIWNVTADLSSALRIS
jgi:hypothetical protein